MRTIVSIVMALGAGCASVNWLEQALPASFDPGRVGVVEVAAGAGHEVLLRGMVHGPEATPARTRRGELTSATGDHARGDVAIRGDEIRVEVDGLPALAFMTLRVDGEPLMFFRTDNTGRASVRLARVTK